MIEILTILIKKVSVLDTFSNSDSQVVKVLYTKMVNSDDKDTHRLVCLLIDYSTKRKKMDKIFIADQIQTQLVVMKLKNRC